MHHVTELLATDSGASELLTAALEQQRVQQRLIEQSRTGPYRQIAYVFAATYCAALAASAAAAWLWRKGTPGSVERTLAALYQYVPEMALHKTIELRALLHHRFRGRGLDLGCGNGLVGGVLIREAGLADLHGVDLNEACRDSALANGYATFSVGDIQSLRYADKGFDYAISICVIEHVPNLTRTLREVARVLKPGGRLVFTTPAPLFRESTLGYRLFSRLGLRARAEAFKRTKDVNSMQFHYLSPEEWRKVLSEAGFDDTAVTGIFSRRQLLVYDLMNIQVNWMRFYFADKLATSLERHSRLRRAMTVVTAVLSAHVGAERAQLDPADATHYLIACTKKVVSA